MHQTGPRDPALGGGPAQTRPPAARGAAGGNKASARGCHPSGPPPPGAGGFPSPAPLPTGAPTRPRPLAQSRRRLLPGSLRTGGMRGRARRSDVQPAEGAGPENGAKRLPPAREEVGVVGPSSAHSPSGSRLSLHLFIHYFSSGPVEEMYFLAQFLSPVFSPRAVNTNLTFQEQNDQRKVLKPWLRSSNHSSHSS